MEQKKAVALRYPDKAEAPFICVKGKGLLAEKIERLAAEHGVPVARDVALANVLSVYEIGECVPPETYEVLAKIFAFVVKYSK